MDENECPFSDDGKHCDYEKHSGYDLSATYCGIEKDFAPLAGEKHCTHDLQFDGSAGSLDFCTKTVEDFAKVKFRIKDVSSGTDVSEYNSTCGRFDPLQISQTRRETVIELVNQGVAEHRHLTKWTSSRSVLSLGVKHAYTGAIHPEAQSVVLPKLFGIATAYAAATGHESYPNAVLITDVKANAALPLHTDKLRKEGDSVLALHCSGSRIMVQQPKGAKGEYSKPFPLPHNGGKPNKGPDYFACHAVLSDHQARDESWARRLQIYYVSTHSREETNARTGENEDQRSDSSRNAKKKSPRKTAAAAFTDRPVQRIDAMIAAMPTPHERVAFARETELPVEIEVRPLEAAFYGCALSASLLSQNPVAPEINKHKCKWGSLKWRSWSGQERRIQTTMKGSHLPVKR